MRKIISMILLLALFGISPVWALFCQNCGKNLPEAANFCPSCGKPSAAALQPAPPEQTVTMKVVSPQPVQTVSQPVETSLSDYECINQMELLLSNTNYAMASQQAKELRRKYDERIVSVNSNYVHFSPYRRKLHDLHTQKLNAIEAYLSAWRGCEFGPDRVKALAEKDKALFVLSQINEAIETLIAGGSDLTCLSRVEEMERRLQKTSANYIVTAPYLLVDNQRLNRSEPIWIIDVVGASAKVLHMGNGRSAQPICGWVSIYDLEKRSNWRSNPAFFYSSPPPSTTVIYEPRPEPPVQVIIYKEKRYPYRHRPDRHDRHRGHKYVVVDPHFW